MGPTDRRAQLAAVFAGGAAGALARVALATARPHDPGGWPWATLLVNVAGAFALGAVVARAPRYRPLLGSGFCGALTTFSALQLELVDLLEAGRGGLAAAYGAVTLLAGLAAIRLGEVR